MGKLWQLFKRAQKSTMQENMHLEKEGVSDTETLVEVQQKE